jgi:flagellar M-ring protein FliF
MPEQIMRFTQTPRDSWNALEQHQKIKIAAVVGVLILALIITIFLVTRRQYVVALEGLDESEAATISTILDDYQIRHRFRENNTVLQVEEDQVMRARVLAERHDIMTDRVFTYQDALDFSGIGATETVTRENLRRARVADLQQAIMLFDGVVWAEIHLILPDQERWFIRGNEIAQAGVTLRTTRRLTFYEGEAIARFLRRSVQGLEMENIEIMDTEFNVIFSTDLQLNLEDQELAALLEHTARENARIISSVRNLFAPMYSTVSVAPHLHFDPSQSVVESRQFQSPFDPEAEVGIPLQRHHHSASVQGNQRAWEPGLGAQTQEFPLYPNDSGVETTARQQGTTTHYALNEIHTRTVPTHPVYDGDRSSVTVTLTRNVDHDQELLQRVNGWTQADWDYFVLNTDIVVPVEDETRLERHTRSIATAAGVPLTAVAVSIYEINNFIPYEPTTFNWAQLIMFALLALLLILLALGLIRKTQPEEEMEIEPELSVEDLLVSTQMEEAYDEETLSLAAIGYREDSQVKQKVEEFIDEKPEAAASLMRHWLNETEF